jgi:autotransporter-associated beta strand protein
VNTDEVIGSLAGAGGIVSIADTKTLTAGGNNSSTTYAGVIAGGASATFVKDGTGTLTLTGENTVNGSLNITAGTVAVSGSMSDSLNVTVSPGGRYTAKSSDTIGALAAQGTGPGVVEVVGAEVVIDAGHTLTVGGSTPVAITDAAVSTGSGLGVGVLSGTQIDFTGTSSLSARVLATTVTVSNGTLQLIGQDLFGTEAARPNLVVTSTQNAPSVVELINGNHTIGKLDGNGLIKLNGHSLTVNSTGGIWSGTLDPGIVEAGAPAPELQVTGSLTLNEFKPAAGASAHHLVVDTGGMVIISDTGDVEVGDVTVGGQLKLMANGTKMAQLTAPNIQVASGGTLSGIGRINGNVSIGAGGTFSPGASPGFQEITGDLSIAGTFAVQVDGTTSSEYDHVIVSGSVELVEGSALALSNSPEATTTFAPARGDVFHVLRTSDPFAIAGTFGSVSSTLTTGTIISLTSGEVVGTGAAPGVALVDTIGVTANENRMISDLLVSSSGGVEQYRGGDLISRALQSDTTAQTSAVFRAASPEGYAGLADYASRAAASLSDDRFLDDGVVSGGLAISASVSGRKSDLSRSNDGLGYQLSGTATQLGFRTINAEQTTISAFLALDNGRVNTSMMRADVDGVVVGAAINHRIGADERLAFGFDILHGSFDFEGTRTTYDTGVSSFETSSNVTSFGFNASYDLVKSDRGTFSIGFGLRSIDGTIDGFTETNSVVYHGLTVGTQKISDVMSSLSFGGNYQISEQARLHGQLTVGSVYGGENREVLANFTGDVQQFGVVAPGFDTSFSTLNIGLDFTAADNLSITISGEAGLSGSAASGQKLSASLNYRF